MSGIRVALMVVTDEMQCPVHHEMRHMVGERDAYLMGESSLSAIA